MTVSEHQLQLDFDALQRLVATLHDRRRIDPGAPRLLAALVHAGLDERDLPVAAALCVLLDEPKEMT
jgi:hypothetical protein